MTDDDAMQALNEAYAVLGDPDRRAAYDAASSAPPPPPRTAAPPPRRPKGSRLPDPPEGLVLYPRPGGDFWEQHRENLYGQAVHVEPRMRGTDEAKGALSLAAVEPTLRGLWFLSDGDVWMLDASNLPVTDHALSAVGRHPTMSVLDLAGTKVTDSGMRHLVGVRLIDLDLGDCAIGDAGMRDIARISTLRSLTLHGTRVTDHGLVALQHHPNLSTVDIRRTKVVGAGLSSLATIPTLTEVRAGKLRRGDRQAFERARPDVRVLH